MDWKDKLDFYELSSMSFNNSFSTDEALLNLRIAAKGAVAAQKIAHVEYVKAKNELEKWKKRLDSALNSGKSNSIEVAKFQVERYEMIVSKIEPLLVDQNAQVEKIKKQEQYWQDKISYKQRDDVIEVTTHNELSLENKLIFSKGSFDTFFDEIDLIIEIITQKLSNKIESATDLEEISEFIKRLGKEILIKEKMIAELDFRLVSHQIEYYQFLKEAKLWKARVREVDKWGVDEIRQLANAQFQSFRTKAIEVNEPIKGVEENIANAKNLIVQYWQKLDALNEQYSKLHQEFSSIETQADDDSIDAELESLKTKIDSL